MPKIKTFLLRYLLPFVLIYSLLTILSYLPAPQENIKNFARTQTGKELNFSLTKALFISDTKRINVKEEASQITLAYGNRAVIDEQIKGRKNVGMDLRVINFQYEQAYLIGLFFFLSLLLITPISWKRKFISLGLGLVLLYLINSFFIYIITIDHISDSEMGIYTLGTKMESFLELLINILNNAISFVIPVIIWGLLSFRRGDIEHLKKLV